ncbi:hypothetical protein PGTUg99_009323 [Puccinia graminis f. sp. tritici]|uniref:Uncharacterized protein n=1 Tax=Puccinia graminis f. sp. tritici TaxID=56615 RepID=A0A5B0PW20_PUCGR|nr:hypothetical protein PGTUg99_009323 [Puccinia graminis f. sp. tritici]
MDRHLQQQHHRRRIKVSCLQLISSIQIDPFKRLKIHHFTPVTTIKPFELPSQEYEEFDPSAVLALACAGVSMVLQQHILAWLSLFFSVTSIVNNTNRTGRPSSMSPLQGLMFSVLALTTLYTKRLIDPTLV